MKKLALPLGLTVLLFTFAFRPLVGELESWVSLDLPWWLSTLVALALSLFPSFAFAPDIQSDELPPEIVQKVTLAAAAWFLLLKLFMFFGVGSFGSFRFLRYLWRTEEWTLIVITLGVVRYLKPRLLLLIGLTAFALQFGAVLLLSLLASILPDWFQGCITLVIAFFVARWLSMGENSPAERVRKPIWLWGFAAAAALLMMNMAKSFFLGGYTEQAVWVAYLVSFVLMVDSIESLDPDRKPSTLGADYPLMFMVFIALYTTVAMVFNVHKIVSRKIPMMGHDTLQVVLPALICVGIAIGIMAFLKLGERMRSDTPGRGALRWGAILYFVCVLAGGSIFGAGANEGRMHLLNILMYLAIFVLPLMVVAQILMSIGLLRTLFNLAPRAE